MRITKIADSKKEHSHLQLERGEQHADLVSPYPSRLTQPDEMADAIRRRNEAFNLSILAKTLRRKSENKNLSSKLKQIITSALKGKPRKGGKRYKWVGKTPSLEAIRDCLQARFAEKNAAQLGFDLAVLLLDFINENSDYGSLRLYVEWADAFKNKKANHLANSLYSNAILNAQASHGSVTTTARTRALEACATVLLDKKTSTQRLDLSACESKLQITMLAQSLQSTYKVHQNSPALASLLKSTLQQHCHRIYKEYLELKETKPDEAVAEDDLTKQYREELKKYLERHFPIKGIRKKARRTKQSNQAKNNTTCSRSIFLNEDKIKTSIEHQLKNATLQYIIQQGKLIHYGRGSYTSRDLMQIRSDESFVSHFILACGFAANNIRNALAPTLKNDILGKDDFMRELKKLNSLGAISAPWQQLRGFFYHPSDECNKILDAIGGDVACFQDVACALRASIRNIRNRVNHFEKDALDGIASDTLYECVDGSEKSFTLCAPLQDLMTHELDSLPDLYREQLRSMLLFDYYDVGDITQIIAPRVLAPRALPFTPSFGKVFAKGRHLQHEAGEKVYDLDCYFAHHSAEEQGCLARKNAMQLLYEGQFVPRFLSDRKLFASAVKSVLDGNKQLAEDKAKEKQAKKRGYKNQKARVAVKQYAFEQVPQYSDELAPESYLKELHSRLVLDEQAKRAEGKLGHEETGYFQRFLLYVFMKGFDCYIKGNSKAFQFLAHPTKQLDGMTTAERTNRLSVCAASLPIKATDTAVSPSCAGHLAFWCFGKLLSPQHINELSNQLLKYKLHCERLEHRMSSDAVQRLDDYRDILALCRLSAEKFEPTQPCALERYVEKELLQDEPYTQQNGVTPVSFARVQVAQRYATESILAEVLKGHKVSKTDLKELDNKEASIERYVDERERLRKSILSQSSTGDSDYKRYGFLQREIDLYNWLRNKVELVHVRSLHQLLFDILGRLAGFVQLYERNLRFCYDYIRLYHGDVDNYPVLPWEKGLPGFRKEKWNDFRGQVFSPHFMDHKLRDFVAHFNYIGKRNHTLLGLMYGVRQMMAHDRKLQNAVMTSMIDLLDRHGIAIAFSSNDLHDGAVKITRCEPKKVQHLKKIDVALVHAEYATMVKTLLEYKV